MQEPKEVHPVPASVWTKVSYALKWLIGVGVILWLCLTLPWPDLKRAFLLIHSDLIITGLGLLLLYIIVMAVKWGLLMRGIPFRDVLGCCMASRFFSLLPTGQLAAEVSKVVMLRHAKVGTLGVGFTVLLDKLTGIICVLAISLPGFFYTSMLPRFFAWAAVVIIVLLLFWVILMLRTKDGGQLLGKLSRLKRSRIGMRIYGFLEKALPPCCQCLYSTRQLVMHLAAGILFQMLSLMIFYIPALMMGIHLPLLEWSWMFCLLSMVIFVPITVAGVGLREGSLVALLGLMGVDAALAMALSLVITGLNVLVGLLGGIYYWFMNRLIKR